MERKALQRVRLLPEEPTNNSKPELYTPRREIGQRGNPNAFGVFMSGDKAVDMDALTRRIRKKGSGPFQRVLSEVFAEIPPGYENGKLLTHAQVCRMFDVTGMTLYSWRKRFALPVVILKGGRKPPVRYDEGVMLKWAELHGKKVIHTDYHDWC